jgi:hypothetical protein
MGGALLGGVLASIPGVALAAPKPGKGPCQPGQFQCGKKCCPSEASCVRGECVCPAPKSSLVGGACVCPGSCPTGADFDASCNCVCTSTGVPPCGNTCCSSGEICNSGSCQAPCIPLNNPCGASNDCCVPRNPDGTLIYSGIGCIEGTCKPCVRSGDLCHLVTGAAPCCSGTCTPVPDSVPGQGLCP